MFIELLIIALTGVAYALYRDWQFLEDYELLKKLMRSNMGQRKCYAPLAFSNEIKALLSRLKKNETKLFRKDPEVFLLYAELKEFLENTKNKSE